MFKRIGDVFLSTGGLVAGVCFILYPISSLTFYPVFHYISIQSFVFHGAMIYIGIIINKTNYIELKSNDIKYYSSLIIVLSIIAYIVNNKLDTNLMFISQNYPGTLVELIYSSCGKVFPICMTLIQAFPPFYVVYGMLKMIKSKDLKTCEQSQKEVLIK